MREEQHLRNFLRVLQAYTGDTPLAKFLPLYFRQNRQMGSADRRSATDLLYKYFRLGKACANLPDQERVLIADFLCSSAPDAILNYFKPVFSANTHLPIAEKAELLKREGVDFSLQDVFPFPIHLSTGIDPEKFSASCFEQPDLFIRVHRGREHTVQDKLTAAGINFSDEGRGALRLPNGTKLDELFPAKRDFEVQDLSSQNTGTYFKPVKYDKWWDACAASGGKSLLLLSEQQEVKLLVSDIRESVLSNLDERFINAGYRDYQKKEIDLLQNPDQVLHDYAFDGIILDAPCSGSGTWGRSPEMIAHFKEKSILSFQLLQKGILKNIVRFLKPGKPLIYITCSVFKEENEEIVEHIVNEYGMKLESSELLKGYEVKADTMYVARLVGREQ